MIKKGTEKAWDQVSREQVTRTPHGPQLKTEEPPRLFENNPSIFTRAPITKYYTLGGVNSRFIFS